MTSRYHLALAGPVPTSVAELIAARFGHVTIRSDPGRSDPGRTVLEGLIADQAAVRALLGLVWDVGGEVRLLRVSASSGPTGPG